MSQHPSRFLAVLLNQRLPAHDVPHVLLLPVVVSSCVDDRVELPAPGDGGSTVPVAARRRGPNWLRGETTRCSR
nr:hypothetical protein [Cellulosimicrobium sp. MM]